MKMKTKCGHQWRYQCTDDMGGEYYYCIFCLAEAKIIVRGEIEITPRFIVSGD